MMTEFSFLGELSLKRMVQDFGQVSLISVIYQWRLIKNFIPVA